MQKSYQERKKERKSSAKRLFPFHENASLKHTERSVQIWQCERQPEAHLCSNMAVRQLTQCKARSSALQRAVKTKHSSLLVGMSRCGAHPSRHRFLPLGRVRSSHNCPICTGLYEGHLLDRSRSDYRANTATAQECAHSARIRSFHSHAAQARTPYAGQTSASCKRYKEAA